MSTTAYPYTARHRHRPTNPFLRLAGFVLAAILVLFFGSYLAGWTMAADTVITGEPPTALIKTLLFVAAGVFVATRAG